MQNPLIRTFTILVLLLNLITAPQAQAFHQMAHLWVAQEVLKDVLPNGKVTLPPFGEFPVDPQLVTALKTHPAEYRMGSLGPDFFPDILSGQMVVHPGLPGGWQSDDWLKWLVQGAGTKPENQAFAYGYLVHAASDVFAHTYINAYSGDIFSLQDGETDVEARHVALESYIDLFTPLLTDEKGTPLPQNGLTKVPPEFLRDRLILNETVAQEYAKSNATKYLSSIYYFSKTLDKAVAKATQIDNLFKQKNLEDFLNKKKSIEAKITSLKKTADAKSLEMLSLKNQLLPLQASLEFQKMQLKALLASIQFADKATNDINQAIANFEKKLATVSKMIPNPVETISCVYYPCAKLPPVCKKCLPGVEEMVNPLWNQLSDQIQQKKQELKAAAQTQINLAKQKVNIEGLIQQLIGQINTLQGFLQTAQQIHDGALQELFNWKAKLDDLTQQAANPPLSPVAAIKDQLVSWQKDVRDAMTQYIVTSQKISDSFLNGGDHFAPLQDWMACWGPAFTPIPQPLVKGHCAIAHTLSYLDEKLGPIRGIVDPVGELNHILKEELNKALKEVGLDIAKDLVASEDQKKLIDLWDENQKINANILNQTFSTDTSGGKRLLIVPDMNARVDSDMHLTPQGSFDPNAFAAIANSVTLAKLSLLDVNALQILAQKAGLPVKTVYGIPLFPSSGFNMLFDWIKSMDGNNQWLEVAPPHPHTDFQSSDYTKLLTAKKESYGYGFFENPQHGGMRFWQDPDARGKIFHVLFKGPIVPSLEQSKKMGFSNLIGDYPYKTCVSQPFAETMNGVTHQLLMTKAGLFGDDSCAF